MTERKRDELLGIRTAGTRDWNYDITQYYRYEPTSYEALDTLSENYKFDGVNRVVDFGCGRGRVAFYLHNRFRLPVTGIEANSITYEEALENLTSYRFKANHIPAPIEFKLGLAQHYTIDKEDDCFYFFNPFSVHIFGKVVNNILRSVTRDKRMVNLILYYPFPDYIDYLRIKPFTVVKEIEVPNTIDIREKFLIYRLSEEDI
jgi:SAM-dependent methyltransferase